MGITVRSAATGCEGWSGGAAGCGGLGTSRPARSISVSVVSAERHRHEKRMQQMY